MVGVADGSLQFYRIEIKFIWRKSLYKILFTKYALIVSIANNGDDMMLLV